jgi:Zn-dependent protease
VNLQFRLGKIPVRVLPWFFIVSAIINADLLTGDPAKGAEKLALWLVIVFVSVLLHELGHATAILAFGGAPEIMLHGMGGTTSWGPTKTPMSPGRRIVISLAGPFAGFVVGGIVLALSVADVLPPADLVAFAVRSLLFVNLGWGVFNLLPMLPLDGGNVMMQALNAMTNGRGARPAYITSIVVAGVLTPIGFFLSGWWVAILAASFISSNVRALGDLKRREQEAPMRQNLEEAYKALDRQDAARVLELARPVALSAQTAPTKAEALQLVAFGFLLSGRPDDADAAIAAIPAGFAPHPSLLELRAKVRGGIA